MPATAGQGQHRSRYALTIRALPAILHLRVVLDGERIVLRTGVESTLAGATRSTVVAFEAEGCDGGPAFEWSVVATGLARHVTDEHELDRLDALAVPRWTNDNGSCLVSITTERLAGRRSLVGERT